MYNAENSVRGMMLAFDENPPSSASADECGVLFGFKGQSVDVRARARVQDLRLRMIKSVLTRRSAAPDGLTVEKRNAPFIGHANRNVHLRGRGRQAISMTIWGNSLGQARRSISATTVENMERLAQPPRRAAEARPLPAFKFQLLTGVSRWLAAA